MNVYGTINGTMNAPQTLVGSLASVGNLQGEMGAVHGEINGTLTITTRFPVQLLTNDSDEIVTTEGNLMGLIETGAPYISGELTAPATLTGILTVPASISAVYTGEYEFTPTTETQVINIDHKEALQNITINPIPKNYGLVTYNGSILMIS